MSELRPATRSTVHADDIIRLIGRNPQGMSSRQVATAFGMRHETIASRLSRLYLYGKIDREFFPYVPTRTGPRRVSKWLPKASADA